MKTFKKIMALVIAMVMVLSLSFATYATEGTGNEGGSGTEGTTEGGSGTEGGTTEGGQTTTGKSINLTGGKAGHTYTLYQILTGDVAKVGTEEQLTNIQWGADAPDAYKNQYDTAAAAAKAIATQDDARAFAQSLTLSGGTELTLTEDGNVHFEKLKEGYYIIADKNNNKEPVVGDYSSEFVVKVVKDVTGAMKGEKPSSEKKVADINDSTDSAVGQYQDSADYDIGDDVPFQLKATTANNVSSFRKYHITFQDKQSDGLDAPTSFTVTVLGKTFTVPASGEAPAAQVTEKGTKISVAKVTADEGQTFAIKVTFEQNEPTTDAEQNITSYLDAECNKTDILVNYTSKLNSNAVIGSAGNPNTSYIKYSSNPESKDDSDKDEGKTPEDKVIVFTYKTDIDKVDETGAALKGADFALYKEVKGITTPAAEEGGQPTTTYPEGAKKGSELTFAEGVEHSAISADKYYVLVGNKTGSTAGSTFEFKGIDDGVYVLVETSIPTGYNAFKSIAVTVSATHDDESDNPQLTELTSTTPFTANKDAGSIDKADGTKHDAVSGELYAEIENNSGTVLPETGGIGTTIFYVVGAILVLGAGILLVTRRRMSAN